MATTTTNLSLKKPALDDDALIADINNNMDTLDSTIGAPSSASAVDGANAFAKINSLNNKIATSTTSSTAASGVTKIRDTVIKSLKTVTINLILQKSLVLDTGNLLTTLPEGYRPKQNMLLMARNDTRSSWVYCEIKANGEIQTIPTSADSVAAAANIYISATYVVDE